MPREIAVRYSDDLVRTAARRFLIRYAFRDVAVAIVAILFAVGISLVLSFDWKLPAGVLLVALALIVLVLWTGLRCTWISAAKFRSLKEPVAVWRFSDEFVEAKNELGSSEFRWKVITEVWRYPDVWLLLFGKANYSFLPAVDLDDDLKSFLIQQVRQSGGKIL